MGMDPSSAALMAAILGGSVLGGVTAPQGQKLQSFAGHGSELDPRTMSREAKEMIQAHLSELTRHAAEPVNFETTVNPLPSFVGGGLPMGISAPGMDRNRLSLSTGSLSRRRLPPEVGGSAPGAPPVMMQPPPNKFPDDSGVSTPQSSSLGSDADQAAAALELILGRPSGTIRQPHA